MAIYLLVEMDRIDGLGGLTEYPNLDCSACYASRSVWAPDGGNAARCSHAPTTLESSTKVADLASFLGCDFFIEFSLVLHTRAVVRSSYCRYLGEFFICIVVAVFWVARSVNLWSLSIHRNGWGTFMMAFCWIGLRGSRLLKWLPI